MKNARHLVTGLLVLGMAATPLAFAQATPTTERAPPTSQEPTSAPPATGAAEQQPARSSAAGQGLSWADLDADGNGNLSKSESQRHAGLSNVFAQADVDGNGELTADEYRGFVQKQQSEAAKE
ncbi:EF-hand domain-containing protein [Pseudoxanthomonas daejeonensis]|uniref:Calcium-binding protein n=1 Tax=Pseudoxanthomonas daejeonensis TaxID=266062 RepID=A0ABQ6ZAZ7_9GAMM|nr:EF-hand domain-containing protein [Pseudoxanthomonas daejeonensis]KAF1697040.1 calcium-binding protein [Pseudoxanthomonas daejeonensis]UNK56345.1 EF-hand domain-containing protein [Pseudoxanthomonas daejeonensis]